MQSGSRRPNPSWQDSLTVSPASWVNDHGERKKSNSACCLSGRETEEILDHIRRLAAAARVGSNCKDQVGGAAIVQQEDSLS